jgi:transcriptional regulator with XRE-family HTH domain
VTTGKDIKKIFGENLRKFRAQKRLSQRALDAISGIDHGMISRMENGQVNVTLNTLTILAAALQITAYELIIDNDNSFSNNIVINEDEL